MCEHEYRLLDEDTHSLNDDNGPRVIYVSAVFYCVKCLDIQHRKETIRVDERTDDRV